MAQLTLCDLCNGKVKRAPILVAIKGQVQLYEGAPPALPPGFTYREDAGGKRLIKTWDAFGNYTGALEFVEKPAKHRTIRVRYELCETCGQKLTNMLESLRRQYHLDTKEIELLEGPQQPWGLSLLFDDAE